jgi:hypothetical protein
MPNINFDIFYDTDTFNITASRGIKAPKVKPSWKVRNAPKLPPKEPPLPVAERAFGPKKAQSAASESGEKPEKKKNVPKLEVRKKQEQEQQQKSSQ